MTYSLSLIYPQNTEFDKKLYAMALLTPSIKTKNRLCVKVYRYILKLKKLLCCPASRCKTIGIKR